MEDHSRMQLDQFISEFDDREKALSILKKFAERSVGDVKTLYSELESGNHAGFHRLAHALKGGAMNIGAVSMMEKARTLESIYKENNFFADGMPETTRKDILEKLAELETEIVYLSDFIDTL